MQLPHKNRTILTDINSESAFKLAYLRYSAKVYGVCIHKVQSKEDAEEIVQDVFRSAWENREKFKTGEPLENYLIKAAKYKLIDYYRKQQVKNQHLTIVSETAETSNNSTEDHMRFTDLKETVFSALHKLPSKTKEIFWMSRKKGLTNKEIAAELKVSEKTIEYHISSALKKFKVQLAEYI
ncbi:RNA polymerase sigma factor [Flavobacterium sp. FlaQc-52]|uniref:RNA polymerase sigma factor n=1 Tax=Flavobacterium sp. FlaQc-52 TaxID=3374185 RepID=UPI003756C104